MLGGEILYRKRKQEDLLVASNIVYCCPHTIIVSKARLRIPLQILQNLLTMVSALYKELSLSTLYQRL